MFAFVFVFVFVRVCVLVCVLVSVCVRACVRACVRLRAVAVFFEPPHPHSATRPHRGPARFHRSYPFSSQQVLFFFAYSERVPVFFTARLLPTQKQKNAFSTMAGRQPPAVYWEAQEDLHCGRHAVNMILGQNLFSSRDIDREAREVDARCGAGPHSLEGFVGQTSADYVPCATGGNWDADVLLKALNSRRGVVTAEYAEQQMPPPEVFATTYLGTLIHRAGDAGGGSRLESRGGHYTCFRKVGTQLYHLDSLNKASANRAISSRAAQRLLQQPDANCWHVFTDAPPARHHQQQRQTCPPTLTHVRAKSPGDQAPTAMTESGGVSVRTPRNTAPAHLVGPQTPPAQTPPARRSPVPQKAASSSPQGGAEGGCQGQQQECPQQLIAPGARRPESVSGAPPVARAPSVLAGRARKRARSRRRRPRRNKRSRKSGGPAGKPPSCGSNGDSSDPGRFAPKKKSKTGGATSPPEQGTGPRWRGLTASDLTEFLRDCPRDFLREAISNFDAPGRPQPPSLPDATPWTPDDLGRAQKRPRRRTRVSWDFDSIPENPEEEEAAAEADARQSAESGDGSVVSDGRQAAYAPLFEIRHGGPSATHPDAAAPPLPAVPELPDPDAAPLRRSIGGAEGARAGELRGESGGPLLQNKETSVTKNGEEHARIRGDDYDGGDNDNVEEHTNGENHADGTEHLVVVDDDDIAAIEDAINSHSRDRRQATSSDAALGENGKTQETGGTHPRNQEGARVSPRLAPHDVCSSAGAEVAKRRKQEGPPTTPDGANRSPERSPEREKPQTPGRGELRGRDKCDGGSFTAPCAFSRTRPGTPARRRRNHPTCFWCSAEIGNTDALPVRRWKNFLDAFRTFPPDVQARALSRMRPELRNTFHSSTDAAVSPRHGSPGSGYCPGRDRRAPCFYSLTNPGVAARLSTGCHACWWCSLAEMVPDGAFPRAAAHSQRAALPGQNSAALEFAVAHVFSNFPPHVQRQARIDSARPIRDILNRTRGLCRGAQFGNPCEFSTRRPGTPVRTVRNLQCMCCKPDFARRLRADKSFFSRVRRRVYLALQPVYRAVLLKRVPEHLQAEMALEPMTPQASWVRELHRRQTWVAFAHGDRAAYRAHALNDQRRARNAFSFPKRRLRRGAAVQNETTLPVAKLPIARAFERWCEYDSWAVCQGCARMQPRELTQDRLLALADAPPLPPPGLTQADSAPPRLPSSPSPSRPLVGSPSSNSCSLRATAPHSLLPSSPSPDTSPPVSQQRRRAGNRRSQVKLAAPTLEPKHCTNCSAKRPHDIPAPQDVPEPLRNLAHPILRALSPLDILTGPLVRAGGRASSAPKRRRRDQLATGYRQHTSMIRFSWRGECVDAQVAALKTRRLRAKGAEALAFLKASRDSDYHEFYREHQMFLRRQTAATGGAPGPESRLLSLAFLERPGLECALWPHLFWRRDLCFSRERATDPRRGRQRQHSESAERAGDAGADLLLPTSPPATDSPPSRGSTSASSRGSGRDEYDPDPKRVDPAGTSRSGRKKVQEQAPRQPRAVSRKNRASRVAISRTSKGGKEQQGRDEPPTVARHSAKRSFAAKALGPLLGYGNSFEILQYIYDLTMWSSIGSKRAVGDERVPLRLMMKGYPFSPLYWKSLHLALVDMVRQLGPPVIFWTFAPYEWSFPYHVWIRDAMSKQLRGRLFLPVAETLHLAHVMTQVVRGLLTGRSHGDRREGGRWTTHLLAARDPRTGRILDLPFFARLEFQDGTRKAATQDYHGSGRPHVHVLVFCKKPQLLPMADVACATVSGDQLHPALKQYVLGSQRDQSKNSGRDVSQEPTYYDREAAAWRLYHSPKDKAAGLRAFFPLVMDSLKCHQDLQLGTGKGLLAAYVAKYVSKFSGSALDEWLSDYLEANAVAANFLYRYKPFEPEMILQIFGQRFRQWDISTDSRGKRDFRVPLPGAPVYPKEISQYVQSDWRLETTSLLDFLRKTNDAGEIAGWLRRKYKQEILLARGQEGKPANRGRRVKTRKDAGEGAVDGPRQRTGDSKSRRREPPGGRSGRVGRRAVKRGRERSNQQRRGEGGRNEVNGSSGAARDGCASEAEWSEGASSAEVETRAPQSLASFAALYDMQGEQVVAADMHSRAADTFYGQWVMLHVPFRNPEALLNRDITARVPKHLQFLANVLFGSIPVAETFWRNEYRVRGEMESEGHAAAYIESTLGMIRANRELIADYIYAKIADGDEGGAEKTRNEGGERENGRPFGESGPLPARGADRGHSDASGIIRAPLPDSADLNSQQRRFVHLLNAHMEMSARLAKLRTPEARESHVTHLRSSKAVVCMGPPGTGKTTAARLSIKVALDLGGQVLLALPTAHLASNLRTYYVGQKNVVIDTCAAAFGLMEDPCESLPHLSLFSLIAVDEFSQLSQIQFERIVKLWASADKLPALVFCGDPYQMSGFGLDRPWHSRLWRVACDRVLLVQAYRCKDPQFWAKLSALRIAKPSEAEVRELCVKRKAWQGYPNVRKIRRYIKRFPQTTILTCTRRGTSVINNLVLRAKFPKRKPLAYLPGDVDANPDNYLRDGAMKPASQLRSLWVPIFLGMKICITQNVRKEADFVNGMVATVEEFYPASSGLRVRTATGRCVVIYKWKNPREPGLPAHYPIRPGYASTIAKYQGAELSHVTVYLDARNVPGAAYTALSRVQSGRQYRLAGRGRLDPDHFTPADVSGLK